ncbi:MAG: peptidoglycan DD-metalloendopeptidase family protein [bacterium]|nr:peptidoglycan DD-metalloendopeptidase family protein [bacterium]
MDYGYPVGTDINAAAAGEIEIVSDGIPTNTVGTGWGFGNHVYIRHPNGYRTIYAHMLPGTIMVRRGDHVEAGQLLGRSDNTGRSSANHLHFEVQDPQRRRVNPYGDPPDYTGGCGPNALWMTCPPTPAPPPDTDGDGFTVAQGDCDNSNRDVHPGGIESCNGRDDDCNGTSDDPWREGLSIDLDQPCTVGIGACASTSTWACAPNGATVVCDAEAGIPAVESCNGFDDDCDGETDEDWRQGLTIDVGDPCTIEWDACRGSTTGAWACTPDGRAVVCDAADPGGSIESPEICDGTDNDCNGAVDDVALAALVSDSANCGSCGNVCTGGNICREGACVNPCRYSACAEYCRYRQCGGCGCGWTDSCYAACLGGGYGDFSTNYALQNCLCFNGCRGCF